MSCRTLALQRAFLRSCFGERAGLGDDVDARDRAALEGQVRRLGLYRTLLRQNVSGTVSSILPRTKAVVEGACPGAFHETVARFLAHQGPRTHHLRDVPGELVGFVEQEGFSRAASLPPHVVSLAQLEWADFQVNVAPRASVAGAVGDLAPSRAVALRRPLRVLRQPFDLRPLFDGHPDAARGLQPEARETFLLLYRDVAHGTRWMALTAAAFALVEALLDGEALGGALARAAAASGSALDDALLAGTAALLSDLAERGVVLGGVVDV